MSNDMNFLVESIANAIAMELEAAREDVQKIAETANRVCQTEKVVVCNKEFEEDELLENFRACYKQLRRSQDVPANKKVRAATFCREAAILLKPKNKNRIVAFCDKIIARGTSVKA